jgi:hypothetical protein
MENNMTYGEYHYAVKYDMRLVNGEWVVNKPNITIPNKMSKEDAGIYYTNKFREYWKKNKDK